MTASASRSPARDRVARRGRARGGAPRHGRDRRRDRCTLRLDIASPSGSRTVGQTSIRDRDVEVAHEPADHDGLLRVLLAEVGHVGRDHVEELGDDGRHAVEVRATPVGALERLGHPGHRHGRGEAGRVDLLDRRREQVVDARPRRRARRRARWSRGYASRSRGVVELRRVHEQRHDDHIAVSASAAHQRQVALVEGAHRRNQSDRRPARRGSSNSARSSATLRITFMPAGPRALRGPRARGWRSRARRTAAAGPAPLRRPRRAVGRSSPRRRAPPARSARAPGRARAQFSTVARTSGTSCSRSRPAPTAIRSAAASSVTRKFDAIEAAAW